MHPTSSSISERHRTVLSFLLCLRPEPDPSPPLTSTRSTTTSSSISEQCLIFRFKSSKMVDFLEFRDPVSETNRSNSERSALRFLRCFKASNSRLVSSLCFFLVK